MIHTLQWQEDIREIKGNVKALAMKKWFNTNYHYIVPEIDDDTEIKLNGTKPVDEFKEAKALGIDTKVSACWSIYTP